MAWVEKHGSGFRVRYRLSDGSVPSETGFGSHREAADRAADVESEQRTGAFVDPRLAQTCVGDWVRQWSDAHDVAAGTWAKYDAHLRNHILPRFGAMGLGEVSRMTVKAWVKSLRRSLAEATVMDVVSLLSTIFNEAVDEGLIGANPCRRLRINTGGQSERPTATATQVTLIAARARFMDQVMMVMAAYTGMRWGELAGLQWPRTELDAGLATVDGKDGALHEVGGTLSLGPPKTKAGARVVHLPPFPRPSACRAAGTAPNRTVRVHRRRRWLASPSQLPTPGLATRHHRRHPTRMGTHRPRTALPRPTPHPQDLADRGQRAPRPPTPTPRTPTTRCGRDLLPRHTHDDHNHAGRSATAMGATWEHESG